MNKCLAFYLPFCFSLPFSAKGFTMLFYTSVSPFLFILSLLSSCVSLLLLAGPLPPYSPASAFKSFPSESLIVTQNWQRENCRSQLRNCTLF